MMSAIQTLGHEVNRLSLRFLSCGLVLRLQPQQGQRTAYNLTNLLQVEQYFFPSL